MRLKAMTCTVRCPLNCDSPVLSEIRDDKEPIDIMFVGEAPGREEEQQKRPFCGKTGLGLRSVLSKLNEFYDFNCIITNVVRGRPKDAKGDNRPPTIEECSICGKYLKQEIHKYKPKIIVTLGGIPYYYLMNKAERGNILLDRGCIRETVIKNNTYPIIGAPHPSFIMRQLDSNLFGILYKDIEKALIYLRDGEKFIVPNTFKSEILNTVEDVRNVLEKMKSKKDRVGFDTETDNLGRVYGNTLFSIQLSNDGVTGYLIPYAHVDSPFTKKDLKKINKYLYDFFTTSESRVKGYIAHNAPFDMHQLLREVHILQYNAPILDTQLGAYLLDENYARLVKKNLMKKGMTPYSLGFQMWQHGFTEYQENEDMSKDIRTRLRIVPLKRWAPYACCDATNVYNLLKVQLKEATYEGYRKQFLRMMENFGTRISKLITYTEHGGFSTNIETLRELVNPNTSMLVKEKDKVLEEFHQLPSVRKVIDQLLVDKAATSKTLFGTPMIFDPKKASHKEALFFGVLQLTSDKKGKSGKMSVDKLFQTKYADLPEVKLLSTYSRIAKLQSTYVDNIYVKMSPSNPKSEADFYTDFRVRARYGFSDTVTGRLNSSNPNQQNRPARGDRTDVVLSIYEAPVGRTFAKFDYSTFEVRGLQIVSNDDAMGKTFKNIAKLKKQYRSDSSMTKKDLEAKADTHIQNAALFFKVKPEEVTKAQRNAVKRLVFGTIYGMSIKTIAKNLDIKLNEAEELQQAFFNAAKKGAEWLQSIVKRARKDLYVESLIGRRRRLWGYLKPNDKFGHLKLDRLATNAPIQGLCSDMAIIAGGNFVDFIYKTKRGIYQAPAGKEWRIINLIHDSVEVEIPVEDVYFFFTECEKLFTSELKKSVKELFNVDITIPLEIDFEAGKMLSKMHKWDGRIEKAIEIQALVLEEDRLQRERLKK